MKFSPTNLANPEEVVLRDVKRPCFNCGLCKFNILVDSWSVYFAVVMADEDRVLEKKYGLRRFPGEYSNIWRSKA